jgi:small subunit ribosomal protein S9
MNNINQTTISTIGKRKTSVAKIFLVKGEKNITINEKTFQDFFKGFLDQSKKLIFSLELIGNYDIRIHVRGGGIMSQLDAISLALAKSACIIDKKNRGSLKKNHLLTRDSRIKERRKYGLKKARKASQYSKR